MSNPVEFEKAIFKIRNRKTDEYESSYERGNYDKYEFSSPSSARHSNVHGIFKDKEEYAIERWLVTYQLMDDDCD